MLGLENGFVLLPSRCEDAASLSPNGLRSPSVFGVPGLFGVGFTVVAAEGTGWP